MREVARATAAKRSGGESTSASAAVAVGWKGRSMSREPYLMAPPSAKLAAPSLSRNAASLLVVLVVAAALVEAVGGGGSGGGPGRVSPSPLLLL